MLGNTRSTLIGVSRGFLLALLCCAVLAGCSESKTADGALDTSRLPRVVNAKESFASEPTTVYIAPMPVAETAKAVREALTAAGWLKYIAPFAAQTDDPSLRIMSLKKGPQGLNVLITRAPAQGNTTSVTYTAVVIAYDLPFPKDATKIAYDPNRPHLNLVTNMTIAQTLAFFRSELAIEGWKLWTAQHGVDQSADTIAGQITERGAYAYYVRENQRPLLLVLQRAPNDKVMVELKAVPAEALTAESRNAEPAVTPGAQAAASPQPPAQVAAAGMSRSIAGGRAADKIMQQATHEMTTGTTDGVKPPPAPNEIKVAETALHGRAANGVPIPVTEDAQDVQYDGASGSLEFTAGSSVKSVADFYRAELTQQGWRLGPTVIDRANMVVLNFAKDGRAASFTIMQMGNKVDVSAEGPALKGAAAKSAAAGDGHASAPRELEAEESGGLPVPKTHTLAEGTRTPFRRQLDASVPVDLELGAGVLPPRAGQSSLAGADGGHCRHGGSRGRQVCVTRRRRRAHARPQERRDQCAAGGEESGGGRQGRHRSAAGPIQDAVRQHPRHRRHDYHRK